MRGKIKKIPDRHSLLGKSNEVLMVGVHVRELTVNEHHDLVLALLLLLPDVGGDDPLRLLSQARIPLHLGWKIK